MKKREEEAKRWYLQALYDLKAAKWNKEGEFFETACFLSQQASEKVLKSFLYFTGASRETLLTHSIFEMAVHGQKHLDAMREILEYARELDLHYVPSRYPNGLPSGYPHSFYSGQTALNAINSAEKIFNIVRAFYEEKGLRHLWEDG
ncbi:MAG TPA: HEPN domain-containing protein [Candidatus Brocadiaceae bacterium]|nr:MAG: hypothetical protein A2Y09_07935 [Planctomycetes bacterium GWA2_39_15]